MEVAILLRTKHNKSWNGRHAKAALFGSEIA